MKTLKKISEEFDKNFEKVRWESHTGTGSIKDFIKVSIKDALEAVRVENIDQVELPNGRIVDEAKFRLFGKHMMIKGYNQCTTQYDENVKSFLGEK